MNATNTQAATDDPEIGKPLFAADIRGYVNRVRALLDEMGFRDEKAFGYLKYAGQWNGRDVTVTLGARTRNKYVTPDVSYKKYMGMILTIGVTTSVKTRLLISPIRSNQLWLINLLQRWRGNRIVKALPRVFDHHRVWAHDPDWTHHFLHNDRVQSDMASLLGDEIESTGNLVVWGQGCCDLTLSNVPQELTSDHITGWILGLDSSVGVAESSRPPREAPPSWIERQVEDGQLWRVVCLVLFGSAAVLAFLALLLVLLVVLLLRGL